MQDRAVTAESIDPLPPDARSAFATKAGLQYFRESRLNGKYEIGIDDGGVVHAMTLLQQQAVPR